VSGNGFSLSLAQDASLQQISERKSRRLQSSCCLRWRLVWSKAMERWRRGRRSLTVLSIRSNGSMCRRVTVPPQFAGTEMRRLIPIPVDCFL
jgi:hypothetical protein